MYSRMGAVEYAKQYALNPNISFRYFKSHEDGGGDCTNFISQCLLAGGATMNFNLQPVWWYKKGMNSLFDTWSTSWSVAHSFYWMLKVRGKINYPGLKGFEIENLDDLDLGDVIQYENISGRIYHSAIVTSFTFNSGIKEPLISQHSVNSVNIYYKKKEAIRLHLIKIVI